MKRFYEVSLDKPGAGWKEVVQATSKEQARKIANKKHPYEPADGVYEMEPEDDLLAGVGVIEFGDNLEKYTRVTQEVTVYHRDSPDAIKCNVRHVTKSKWDGCDETHNVTCTINTFCPLNSRRATALVKRIEEMYKKEHNIS
jgi:hypothetical protein